jgi:hypothetical protein
MLQERRIATALGLHNAPAYFGAFTVAKVVAPRGKTYRVGIAEVTDWIEVFSCAR